MWLRFCWLLRLSWPTPTVQRGSTGQMERMLPASRKGCSRAIPQAIPPQCPLLREGFRLDEICADIVLLGC
jgi:hypothetical protein